MSTTNLFAELVIIGVSAFVWVVLVVFTLIGYDWVPVDSVFTAQALVLGIAIIYVLGIVSDRAADAAFGRWFKADERDTEYYKARQVVFTRSDRLSDILEYGRSRLRICRGWAFNAVLIAIALNSFIWFRLHPDSPRVSISAIGTTSLVTLAVGCWVAWRKLDRAEYRRSKANAQFLQEDEFENRR